MPNDNALGEYLKDRRKKMDPASLGLSLSRRRTPGLRREEVALRANVSATWYTWLEQGRGGTPSADVLDRLARGLALSDREREHLFLLAQNRPPEVLPMDDETVTPSLLHVLESLELSPATIRSAAWDVLAANRAAKLIFAPKGVPPARYNIIETFFEQLERGHGHGSASAKEMARIMTAQFRAEVYRSGFGPRVQEVIERLKQTSELFGNCWDDKEVDLAWQPIKTFVLEEFGSITFETNSFAVEGHPGMKMMVFTPATKEDRLKVRRLLDQKAPD